MSDSMFRYMHYIYCVYQSNSFSRAAEKLYIAQPSLSLTIKKAEEQLGAQIFNRSTNPITLTDFGVKYIDAVESILQKQEELERYLNDITQLFKGHFTVGASNFWATYYLPEVISKFKAAYPGVSLELFEDSTSNLAKKLSEGQLDLVLTNTYITDDATQYDVIHHSNSVLAVPKAMVPDTVGQEYKMTFSELCDHHQRPSTDLTSFQNLPFVLLRPGNDTRTRADRIFAQSCMHPKIFLELDQISTCYRMACNGLGATIVSDFAAIMMGIGDSMNFFTLSGDDIKRDIRIYHRKNAVTTPAMEEFIKFSRNINYPTLIGSANLNSDSN